jgi:hypothetical protein
MGPGGPNGKVVRVSCTSQEASWAGAVADFSVIHFHFVDTYSTEGAAMLRWQAIWAKQIRVSRPGWVSAMEEVGRGRINKNETWAELDLGCQRK